MIKYINMATTKENININEIINIFINQYGPIEKIFLFGSHARGGKLKMKNKKIK